MKTVNKIQKLLLCLLMIGLAATLQAVMAQTSESSTNIANRADEFKLLRAGDVVQAFNDIPKTPPTNKKIIDEKYYNVAAARVKKRNGAPEFHRTSDRIFFIKKGDAVMRIGGEITDPQETTPGETRSISGTGYKNYREIKIKAGDILSIPRAVVYQIIAEKSDISFIVVRIN